MFLRSYCQYVLKQNIYEISILFSFLTTVFSLSCQFSLSFPFVGTPSAHFLNIHELQCSFLSWLFFYYPLFFVLIHHYDSDTITSQSLAHFSLLNCKSVYPISHRHFIFKTCTNLNHHLPARTLFDLSLSYTWLPKTESGCENLPSLYFSLPHI